MEEGEWVRGEAITPRLARLINSKDMTTHPADELFDIWLQTNKPEDLIAPTAELRKIFRAGYENGVLDQPTDYYERELEKYAAEHY